MFGAFCCHQDLKQWNFRDQKSWKTSASCPLKEPGNVGKSKPLVDFDLGKQNHPESLNMWNTGWFVFRWQNHHKAGQGFLNFHHIFKTSLLKGNRWNLLKHWKFQMIQVVTFFSTTRWRSPFQPLKAEQLARNSSWYIHRPYVGDPTSQHQKPGNLMTSWLFGSHNFYPWRFAFSVRWIRFHGRRTLSWTNSLRFRRRPGLVWRFSLNNCGFCRCFYLGREVILQQELGLIQRCLCLVVWWFVFFMVGFVWLEAVYCGLKCFDFMLSGHGNLRVPPPKATPTET